MNSAFIQALFDTEKKTEIAKELEKILSGSSVNSISDRKQVASCIAAGIPYFITYDEAIIRKKDVIKTTYDVEIYTPQEFLMKIDQLLESEVFSYAQSEAVSDETTPEFAEFTI